jgi:hypothetical protein
MSFHIEALRWFSSGSGAVCLAVLGILWELCGKTTETAKDREVKTQSYAKKSILCGLFDPSRPFRSFAAFSILRGAFRSFAVLCESFADLCGKTTETAKDREVKTQSYAKKSILCGLFDPSRYFANPLRTFAVRRLKPQRIAKLRRKVTQRNRSFAAFSILRGTLRILRGPLR